MKLTLKYLLLILLFLLTITPVFAKEEFRATESQKLRSLEKLKEQKNFIQNLREKLSTNHEEKLEKREELKTRTCETKVNAVKNRSDQLIRMVTNMEIKFSSISARTQDYYVSKVLPTGKTLPNYDNLVSDIVSKRSSVYSALTEAKTGVESFTCDTENPRALFSEFRTDIQEVKESLKEYRTSIKNLIVAVKSLNEE